MEINWLTIVAQIVNFLILVWLLKRFLYGPIIAAMDEREAKIARRMQSAEEKDEQAQEQATEYRGRLHELEERREEMLQLASSEATAERERLLVQAREDVATTERRWHKSLAEEKQAFLRELRRRAGEQLCRIARQALDELADADLEAQIIETFLGRLEALPEDDRRELTEAVVDAGGVVAVASAFEIEAASRVQITQSVRVALTSEATPEFAVSEQVMCGIELRAGGRKVSWSLDSYLSAIEEELADTIAREVDEGK